MAKKNSQNLKANPQIATAPQTTTPTAEVSSAKRWLAPAAMVLMLGAAALMATVAFSGQRYFEWQVEEGRKISQ